MSILSGKTILVGVTGGIAAYKAADLVSQLKKLGADVWVLMTKHAEEFVGPITFKTLSDHPVMVDVFDEEKLGKPVLHISLAEQADLVIIAPATANFLGKMAEGIADDLLSTVILATKAPVLIAPAMNPNMWSNQAVQANVATLKSRGVSFVEPDWGLTACGDLGEGRLAEVSDILERALDHLHVKRDLNGLSLLVTAGPTREFLDPVRYIGNPSSGRMGYAIAAAAADRGADVTLVSGPTELVPALNIKKFIRVTTAQEMHNAVLSVLPKVNGLIMAAAVADYRPAARADQKIKKEGDHATIELVKAPDILMDVASHKRNQFIVGFAAETDNHEQNGRRKLESKQLDLIVVNDVGGKQSAFGGDSAVVTILSKDGSTESLPHLSKIEIAHRLLDRVAATLYTRA